jgi:hypothetical protein
VGKIKAENRAFLSTFLLFCFGSFMQNDFNYCQI